MDTKGDYIFSNLTGCKKGKIEITLKIRDNI